MLEETQHWREGEDRWRIGGLEVRQTRDGLVTVEKKVRGGRVLMRASPNNGKVRFESREVVVTGSRGEEEHLFLRSGDRRLHYSGQVNQGSCTPCADITFQSKVFTVRNAGHSAGFDEAGTLRIF